MLMNNLMKCIYIFLYIGPFAILRYKPFTKRLRVSVKALCVIYIVALFVQAALFCLLSGQSVWNDVYTQIFRLGFAAGYAILSFTLIKDNIYRQFYIWALILAFAGFIMANANFTEAVLHPRLYGLYPYMIANLMILFQILILFPAANWYIRNRLSYLIEAEYSGIWHLVAIIPMLIYTLTMISSWSIATDKVASASYLIVRYFTLFSMLLITNLLTKILKQSKENANLSEKAKTSEWLLAAERTRYRMMAEYSEESRRVRHDLRHHVSVVQAYFDNGDREKLQKYIDQYQLAFLEETIGKVCNHDAVNVIVCHYFELAKKAGIHFEVKIKMNPEVGISDVDLTIVFGNLLENALEACIKQGVKNPFIKVHAMVSGRNVVITVDNSFVGEIHKDRGEFLSSKRQEKGIGLASVQAVVNKYDGIFRIENREQVFRVSIMLKTMC